MPDGPEAHLKMIARYADAGFDELYMADTGPRSQGLFDLHAKHILPNHR